MLIDGFLYFEIWSSIIQSIYIVLYGNCVKITICSGVSISSVLLFWKAQPEPPPSIVHGLTQLPGSVVHLYSMQITEQLQYIADWLTTQSARLGARAGHCARIPHSEWTVQEDTIQAF